MPRVYKLVWKIYTQLNFKFKVDFNWAIQPGMNYHYVKFGRKTKTRHILVGDNTACNSYFHNKTKYKLIPTDETLPICKVCFLHRNKAPHIAKNLISFGKYKGFTFQYVFEQNLDYFIWLYGVQKNPNHIALMNQIILKNQDKIERYLKFKKDLSNYAELSLRDKL